MNIRIALLITALLITSQLQAQLVSYNLTESFTAAELDSFFASTGFSLPVKPTYDIDVYKVIYKTPYKHIDSLVNVSGLVIVPNNVPCSLPLGCYAHGTSSKWNEVPSYGSSEKNIGLFFAGIGGVLTVLPDGLGLGDSDSSIIMHPYHSYFHESNTSLNLLRAARQISDSLELELSGKLVLTGYSQGGYTTMATHKLIQEEHPFEFEVTASAPMSGAYDLKNTMVEVMMSDSVFPNPAYLPFFLLGYYSIYPSLQQKYPDLADLIKAPNDTLLPALFHSRTNSIGHINQYCTPVPKLILRDTMIQEFRNDSLHPLRVALAENDLLGWAPWAPVKIFYCLKDKDVSPLNAERAYDSWTSMGAQNIEKENFGNLDHNGCVQPAITAASLYLLGKLGPCVSSGIFGLEEIDFSIFPNPTSDNFQIRSNGEERTLSIFDLNGRLIFDKHLRSSIENVDVSNFQTGIYIIELKNLVGKKSHQKLIIR